MKQKEIHRLREQTWLLAGGEGKNSGEGIGREFGMDIYILLYLKWITNKDLLHNIWKSSQCYLAA